MASFGSLGLSEGIGVTPFRRRIPPNSSFATPESALRAGRPRGLIFARRQRLMAFALKSGKSIGRQLKRIARKELGRASKCLLREHSEESVHEARKSVKKVEAVLRLFDQVGFAPERKDVKRLRAARRVLSPLRDADAIRETFE